MKYSKTLPLFCLSLPLALGTGSAFAFTSYARDITGYCDTSGYTLLPEYASDTCDAACHSNPQGNTAYENGDLAYFCPPPPVVDEPTCTDADGDGYFAEGEACGTLADFDDGHSTAYPGAAENCSDGIDNDGNGLIDSADPNAIDCPVECVDMDADGYSATGGSCGPIDCNDMDSTINPGATESCSDGIDNNCNGLIDSADMNAVDCPISCTDKDQDGYSIEGGSCGVVDCNDDDANINPGALEVCDDGIDNNCNNRTDSEDAVCQTGNDGSDDDKPWWRCRQSEDRDESHERSRDHDRDRSDDDREEKQDRDGSRDRSNRRDD
ncbi:MAG: putative metal-binding motif-containing protein [Candidatus Thiodiazotropha sp.]